MKKPSKKPTIKGLHEFVDIVLAHQNYRIAQLEKRMNEIKKTKKRGKK